MSSGALQWRWIMRFPSKPTLFIILMVASAIAVFVLPATWTAWVRRPFQLITPILQWPTFTLTHAGERAVRDVAAGDTREGELEAALEMARLQLAQQSAALSTFERLLADVSGLRAQMPDQHVKIVVAPIASYDANPRRESLTVILSGDQAQWVKVGQWVAAGAYETPTREVLAGQWLVGKVSEVQTRTARIQLAGDPKFRATVQLGRVESAGAGAPVLRLASDLAKLEGTGQRSGGLGLMRIEQSPADYFELGDRIVVAPASRELPAPMVVGRLTGSTPHAKSPQHFDLAASAWSSPRSLTHVYIICP